MEKNVALIGAGGIGMRHLQSLMRAEYPVKIFAVEINDEVRKTLSKEFLTAIEEKRLTICGETEELPNHIEAAIIATTSAVRRSVFERLLNHTDVKNVILEKVLFQKPEDYAAVDALIRERDISVWVNCARREMDAYQRLKNRIKDTKMMTIHITGGNWGLGCNGIHMLDLISYLADSDKCSVDASRVLSKMYESKRKGFYEFNGTITGDCGKCAAYEITSFPDSSTPALIAAAADTMQFVIDEAAQTLHISEEKENWEWKKEPFEIPYQSHLTHRTVEKILKTGNCELPDYHTSMKLHLSFITELMKVCKACGWEEESCPIT